MSIDTYNTVIAATTTADLKYAEEKHTIFGANPAASPSILTYFYSWALFLISSLRQLSPSIVCSLRRSTTFQAANHSFRHEYCISVCALPADSI
ncbi:unnamed protein product [Tuber aestivum]|uniref:Uncharacterized protein n=1 Tax=Tuber aestivum TaxID=59557 RepID=A0A292PRX9_9PEZI|nr:unnamed protein product [Tuber aestivum]